jgi:glucose/arabinose dehydrogenase
MKLSSPARLLVVTLLLVIVLLPLGVSGRSQTGIGYEGPLIFDTYTPGPCSPNGQAHGACPQGTLHKIRVVPVATGLMNPWHIAFLPDGRSMLVSESTGRLRLIRDGSLVPEPISGWPIEALGSRVLNSVLVHPQFVQNRLVYLYYAKTGKDGMTTMALARGQLDDLTLSDVREVFVAAALIKGGPIAGRAAFGPDGMIYLSVNDHDEFNAIENTSVRILAQDLGSDVGKVLRVRDDGGIPKDNPFVGRSGARPEVFTYGHRNVTGLAWHPETRQLWATEIGPMGGDELNILLPGRNYGWPHVSLGRLYIDASVSEQSWFRPGMEMPVVYWMPSISPSGLAFYTGDRFPWWKGHLFLGALNGQMLQRIAFNQPMPQTQRRESLLTQLDVRVRHVVQGPDGLLYLAVERRTGGASQPSPDPTGAVLRIEPVD